jgi:hypothetical protein
MGTVTTVFRYLIDEIEHLDATIMRLGELINVGRGSTARRYSRFSQSRSWRTRTVRSAFGRLESVDFLHETIGTFFEQYTRNSGSNRMPSESEKSEEYQFAKGASEISTPLRP